MCAIVGSMTEHTPTPAFVVEWTMGERLRKSMTNAGFAAYQVAAALGCKRWTVNQWLNDHREPDRRTLILWALLTETPLEWLETGAEAPPYDVDALLDDLRDVRNLPLDAER